MNLDKPHRRLNPLTGEWLLVSPHRARRPWLGQVEKVPAENLPEYDPNCYLCPGNERAGGIQNPPYASTFVFDNDFPALLRPESEGTQPDPSLNLDDDLFQVRPEHGICRVACFSPRHDLTLPELTQAEVESVVRMWSDQTAELGAVEYINYVQVFENKGAVMGCSNPHPHCQIWSSSEIPVQPAKELDTQSAYLQRRQRCLLCEYLASEIDSGERIVYTNQHFTALVPFWAVWPFELMILSHRHLGSLPEMSPAEVPAMADVLRKVTAKYDNLFEISFPYSMGFHQKPSDGGAHESWHLHAHYYPPLLRSATVRKFMVGYEMLAMPQRDITAETAAERLRSLPEKHYRSS